MQTQDKDSVEVEEESKETELEVQKQDQSHRRKSYKGLCAAVWPPNKNKSRLGERHGS